MAAPYMSPSPTSSTSVSWPHSDVDFEDQSPSWPNQDHEDDHDTVSPNSNSDADAPPPPPAPPSSLTPTPTPTPIPQPSHDAPSLLLLSFNQDSGYFAAGTHNGFQIYNCDPFREIFRRDFDDGGGMAVVEMLFSCNILALVGEGPKPQYAPNNVMIWDDHQGCCIGELSFRSDVRAVGLRRDRIVVVLERKIFLYNFADLKLVRQIETIANPKGLRAVSQVAGSLVLVCPGLQKGQVRVEHYASKKTKFISAHDSRIACFALTPDGRLLATASTKGTLVRVLNTVDRTLLQEEFYQSISTQNGQLLNSACKKGHSMLLLLATRSTRW